MRRSSGLSGGDRGATALEFALVFPIVMLLTFAIIEFGFLVRDQVATVNLVRDASRIASANPRVGTVDGHRTKGPDASFAYLAARAIEGSRTALPKDSIKELWVYLADGGGNPGSCDPHSCVRYVWADGSFDFASVTSKWDPKSINACPGPQGQSVGVYLTVRHQGLFGSLFPTYRTLSDRSIVKFDPMPEGICE